MLDEVDQQAADLRYRVTDHARLADADSSFYSKGFGGSPPGQSEHRRDAGRPRPPRPNLMPIQPDLGQLHLAVAETRNSTVRFDATSMADCAARSRASSAAVRVLVPDCRWTGGPSSTDSVFAARSR